jgi:methylglutaconyl-CoA hydratase
MASYNTDALAVLKKALWEGTDHWDELLMKRAELSGKLALSPGTRAVLEKFKK